MNNRKTWWIVGVALLAIIAGALIWRGCHRPPFRASTGWIVAWNTSWTGPQSIMPVSRDGRYAYFTTEKFINPDGGAWGRRWRSQTFRGRIDLTNGQVETGAIPSGFTMMGLSGYLMANTVAKSLRADSIPGREQTNEEQYHGYGDGRYIVYICRLESVPDTLTAFLLDNQDTYLVIGQGFKDGWMAADEKAMVLVRDDGDTWLYDIDSRKLKPLGTGEVAPRFYRGLQDLPENAQQIAHEAMGKHCAQRIFMDYPAKEELR